MSIQLLNRSLLATVIGAALALGTPGTTHARDRNSAQYDNEAKAAQHDEKAKARKAAMQQAVANDRAEARADARAHADLNARVNADRLQARARAGVEADARARGDANNLRARQQAIAEARARAAADARRESARNDAARHQAEQAQERARINRAAPYGQAVSAEAHRRNAERQFDRNRNDSRAEDRRVAIARERAREQAYRDYLAQRQRLAQQRSYDLQRAHRLAQYRYQQQYYQSLRNLQLRDSRYDWGSDPYFYSQPTYRYWRSGSYYEVNRYAADMLRQAVRFGYEQGYQAGRADRMDGWRPDYRNSFAYQDANYGYRGYYVDRQEYNHYFREGFQRGYEDGYYRQQRYGRYENGNYSMLDTVLSVILNLTNL
jgi:hypothetical protein